MPPTHYAVTRAQLIRLFRRLETAIAGVTGARPRLDDRRYEERYGVPSPAEPARHG